LTAFKARCYLSQRS